MFLYVTQKVVFFFQKCFFFPKICALCWFILKENNTKTPGILNVTDCPKFTMRIIMTIVSTRREHQKTRKTFFRSKLCHIHAEIKDTPEIELVTKKYTKEYLKEMASNAVTK